jgi:hypothetical protein
MKYVSQFLYGNEVKLPLSDVKNEELYFDDLEDKIGVYKKINNKSILIKTVKNYGELYKIKYINREPTLPNFIRLNP